jgi:hypothetical protein
MAVEAVASLITLVSGLFWSALTLALVRSAFEKCRRRWRKENGLPGSISLQTPRPLSTGYFFLPKNDCPLPPT